ncbi:F0F1 ATP synthase subunit B [Sphingoaurantiacus capsulatus]|uniref:ATP synthase subunit b n=1 Tax=Sphingoaurantiacus capsulatus TaxID=1771310 RepID=A0ABV7XDC0_9SPHN
MSMSAQAAGRGPAQDAALPATTPADAATVTAQEEVPVGADRALGFDATGWVAIAMLVVIIIMLWKRVPAVIGKALDGQIATIRASLDEAASLRAEAEALKAKMAAQLASAEAESKAILAAAKTEADGLVAKAKADATALIARRRTSADAKIGAAERTAIAKVRGVIIDAATGAAATVIAEQSDAKTKKKLTDQAIADLH